MDIEKKKFLSFPRTNRFAVIRMNPVAMVQELDLDGLALSCAQAMLPRKYLVYVDIPLQLPIPGNTWCKYSVAPVATVLRPENPARGITSDMVMPIYPNHQYAKGRVPITPESPFPFNNCFFWIENDIKVRIPHKKERYDDSRAVKMGSWAHCALMSCFDEEFIRMQAVLNELERLKTKPSPAPPSYPIVSSSDTLPDQLAVDVPTDSMDMSDTETGSTYGDGSDDDDNNDDDDDDDDDDADSVASFRDIIALDIFGWKSDSSAVFQPLVDLWYDIEEHLTADTIPSPAELWREQEEIRQIIREGLERKERSMRELTPAVMVADVEVATAADRPSDVDMEMDTSPDLPEYFQVEERLAVDDCSSHAQREGDVTPSKRRGGDEDMSKRPAKRSRHWLVDVASKIGGAFAHSKPKLRFPTIRKDVTVR